MTLNTELRCAKHRHRICQSLSLVNHLVRWEKFTNRATVVARVDVGDDIALRELLEETQDFWEFDPADMVLVRSIPMQGDHVRLEIGVNGMEADHVWKLLAETEPAW